MFEIPNAKRVRRDELYGSHSDAESDNSQNGAEEDVELRAKLNERLSRLLGLDLSAPEPINSHSHAADPDDAQRPGEAEEPQEKQEEEFEFRLFSTSSKAAAPTKVVLDASDDEDAERAEGAFIVPSRPVTYYLAEATPEQREGYQYAAVTADDIVAGAGKRAWGLEKPWRVVKITVSSDRPQKGSSSAATSKLVEDQGDEGAKRKRPGKKRRIALRIKTKAEKAQVDQKMSKEEHLKEKKKRLNREKKLKRRAKEKEQRLAAKGQDGTQAGPGAASDTDDSAA
ncbi:hypothetical protein SLS53_009000 [Cytospora paraplurivora]|uniref:Uncharacterized protein n=1 Tax=Cytospora paraplurivora TaxID=2898453 RepID=A0AAN9TW27_9PEZI